VLVGAEELHESADAEIGVGEDLGVPYEMNVPHGRLVEARGPAS